MGEHRAAIHFGQQKIHLDAAGAMGADKRMPAHICFVTTMNPSPRSWRIWNECGVPDPDGSESRKVGAVGTIQSIYIDDPDQNSIEISSY